jgi:hypothetical protein
MGTAYHGCQLLTQLSFGPLTHTLVRAGGAMGLRLAPSPRSANVAALALFLVGLGVVSSVVSALALPPDAAVRGMCGRGSRGLSLEGQEGGGRKRAEHGEGGGEGGRRGGGGGHRGGWCVMWRGVIEGVKIA